MASTPRANQAGGGSAAGDCDAAAERRRPDLDVFLKQKGLYIDWGRPDTDRKASWKQGILHETAIGAYGAVFRCLPIVPGRSLGDEPQLVVKVNIKQDVKAEEQQPKRKFSTSYMIENAAFSCVPHVAIVRSLARFTKSTSLEAARLRFKPLKKSPGFPQWLQDEVSPEFLVMDLCEGGDLLHLRAASQPWYNPFCDLEPCELRILLDQRIDRVSGSNYVYVSHLPNGAGYMRSPTDWRGTTVHSVGGFEKNDILLSVRWSEGVMCEWFDDAVTSVAQAERILKRVVPGKPVASVKVRRNGLLQPVTVLVGYGRCDVNAAAVGAIQKQLVHALWLLQSYRIGHFDLKMGNVFLDLKRGERLEDLTEEQLSGKVKLADFGFACSFATEHMDDGTFKFVPVDLMSREQISMQEYQRPPQAHPQPLPVIYEAQSLSNCSTTQTQQHQPAIPKLPAARLFGGNLVSAPECLEGRPGLQCDIFSLGLMLWEMCIGRHACQGRTASSTEEAVNRNDRLRYDHMFQHCTSVECRAENEAKRIPFWMCPRCSHVEQLKETLRDQAGMFVFIMSCLHPDPQQRITPHAANDSLSGTHAPFTKPDPDHQTSLSDAIQVQLTLNDHAGDCVMTFPKSLQEKSSRKFACLNLCDITRPMSWRCMWLRSLLKHMTDGQARHTGFTIALSDKYVQTRELLIEFGLAHAIALFAEDVMSRTLCHQDPDIAIWLSTLVDAIEFILSAGEVDLFCAVSIILPPIFRFLCTAAFTCPGYPDVSSRAADIVCDAFRLVSNRTQAVAAVERMELQQTLDDMQRSAKPGRLLGWLYCHQRSIDLMTLMCSHASNLLQSLVPGSPDLQQQLQRLHRLMYCVSIVLKEVKNRVNDKAREIAPDKDAHFIAARKACDLPQNSRTIFNIYHCLQRHLQLPRQSDKQLKQLNDLVLACCADVLDVKSGAISIQDHIIGGAPVQAIFGDVLHETDSTWCFSRLVSLVEVAQKFFNFNSNFQSIKLAAPVPKLVPTGFVQLCKLLCYDNHVEKSRAAVLSGNAIDAHLMCVLVSILELMKESKAPASSVALLHHLAGKQWNSCSLLTEQDVDVLQEFLRELYAAKPSVKTAASVRQSKQSKSRSPHAAFKHFQDDLADKSLADATESMLKALRLPKSSAVGNETITLTFDKLNESVSGGMSTVAAMAKVALYSLFSLPRMFLGNTLEADSSLLTPLRDHREWGMMAILQRLQQQLEDLSDVQEIEWRDRFSPVFQLQALLLSLYSGHEQALLDHRCRVFNLLNNILERTLRPKNLDAACKFDRLPTSLQCLYGEADWMQYVSLSDTDTSNHQTECQISVKVFCNQLVKKGFSAEEALSLFKSQFDFPVGICRTLCTCWCLMVSRHGTSLFTSLGKSCLDAMRYILEQVPLSCLQAKICALDMALALCKHCVPDQLQAGDAGGLQKLLLPLLEDVVKSVQAPSAISADQPKHLIEFLRALTPPTQLLSPSENGWFLLRDFYGGGDAQGGEGETRLQQLRLCVERVYPCLLDGKYRDRKTHAVQYDVCRGRLRLLPPLPLDVQSLLKALQARILYGNPERNAVISDHDILAILRKYEGKLKRSRQQESGAQQRAAGGAAAPELVRPQQPRHEDVNALDFRYLRMMLQDLEGISRGAAVFNHWKVHNGDDTDLSNHDGIVRDGAGIGDVVGDDANYDGNGKWPRANSTDTANSDGDS